MSSKGLYRMYSDYDIKPNDFLLYIIWISSYVQRPVGLYVRICFLWFVRCAEARVHRLRSQTRNPTIGAAKRNAWALNLKCSVLCRSTVYKDTNVQTISLYILVYCRSTKRWLPERYLSSYPGQTFGQTGGRKGFSSQLNNAKTVRDRPYLAIGS